MMLLTSFARDSKTDGQVAQLITLLHGGKKTLK
jgi:aldehyde dehydrogenase (NAD+)